MSDPRGFLKYKKKSPQYRPVTEWIKDFKPVVVYPHPNDSRKQARRCLDCGTPLCHWSCPVGNYIPEWNDLVQEGNWNLAWKLLAAANNFPEFTGRLCPAPCEDSCVLEINDQSVTIREGELAIVEYAYEKGWVKPQLPRNRTKKKVAVVGSGPAGLAAADELNKAGHEVTVFERDEKIGGILRYGVPDFKLEKEIIDRRLKIMKAAGVKFQTGINIENAGQLKNFGSIILTGGSRTPRDLKIPGRELKGICFALDYLSQSNRRVADEVISPEKTPDAREKKVLVIGGGDTGADCVGVAQRQGAASVTQIEVLERPADCHFAEGSQQLWTVLTKKFIGENGWVKKAVCVKVDFSSKDEKGCPLMEEIPGSEFEIKADLVILAIGFIHPEHQGLLGSLGIELDSRGNVKTNDFYQTSKQGVFAAGDMRRGQSLVVWAIAEGRQTAYWVNKLM
jgi:glutamate synthase (NADPH/NADH) small chain